MTKNNSLSQDSYETIRVDDEVDQEVRQRQLVRLVRVLVSVPAVEERRVLDDTLELPEREKVNRLGFFFRQHRLALAGYRRVLQCR